MQPDRTGVRFIQLASSPGRPPFVTGSNIFIGNGDEDGSVLLLVSVGKIMLNQSFAIELGAIIAHVAAMDLAQFMLFDAGFVDVIANEEPATILLDKTER